jgi:alpha-methylacyl-CoA racemase
LRALFLGQPSAHWRALLEGSDVCFAPVLSLDEAAAHPHNAAREVYRRGPDGELDAIGAPRFLPLG